MHRPLLISVDRSSMLVYSPIHIYAFRNASLPYLRFDAVSRRSRPDGFKLRMPLLTAAA